jgi:hypothetical protein
VNGTSSYSPSQYADVYTAKIDGQGVLLSLEWHGYGFGPNPGISCMYDPNGDKLNLGEMHFPFSRSGSGTYTGHYKGTMYFGLPQLPGEYTFQYACNSNYPPLLVFTA